MLCNYISWVLCDMCCCCLVFYSPCEVCFCGAGVGKIECNFLETLVFMYCFFVEHAVAVFAAVVISEMEGSMHI